MSRRPYSLDDDYLDRTQDRRPLFLEQFYGRTVEMWESGCWEWQDARQPQAGSDYGLIYLPPHLGHLSDHTRRGHDYAHRVSWRLAYPDRPISSGLWVLHRCDNPPCVRPDHLYLGTPSDNALDRQRKTPRLIAEKKA
jgi:hypothetical protein